MNLSVVTLVARASRDGKDAFIGQMIFTPVPAADLMEWLEGLGRETKRMFPETFQYAQPVRYTDDLTEETGMGIMVILAPFAEETMAREYMAAAAEAVRCEIEMAQPGARH